MHLNQKSQQKNVSPWNGSYDWGEATPVLTGSLLSGVRTVCQCSKTFSLYCSQGSPVKLSSACEACFIQPADLQSNQCYFSTLAIHYKKGNWETVCKESTVSNDPIQINVTEPFFKKHPPTGTQPLSLNQAVVCIHVTDPDVPFMLKWSISFHHVA